MDTQGIISCSTLGYDPLPKAKREVPLELELRVCTLCENFLPSEEGVTPYISGVYKSGNLEHNHSETLSCIVISKPCKCIMHCSVISYMSMYFQLIETE